jgi:hypothetical protein
MTITERHYTATVAGRTHHIPEMWIAGYCRTSGLSVSDAILFWDLQERLEAGEPVAVGLRLECGHVAPLPGPNGAPTDRLWCDDCDESQAIDF